MKIVHSFWSKPFLSVQNSNSGGGWRHRRFFFMSWALSCLTLNKIYGNISLVTDKIGYEILVKKLKLPYAEVSLELDSLNLYSSNLWALGKIVAYSLQKDPFIHVDGDVYIWSRFGERIENAELIAQSKDVDVGHYDFAMRSLRENNFELPKILIQCSSKDKIVPSNAGILGGNNIDFFEEYCRYVFDFIETNRKVKNSNINGTSYALIYEQYLFSCLAKIKNIDIQYLLSDHKEIENEIFLSDVANFLNKYKSSLKYVHLLSARKKYMASCYELRNQLELEYPNFLDIIEKYDL